MTTNPTVDIQWLRDSHECDTCGMSDAEGAIVSIDGKQVLSLEPCAHCYGGDNWNYEAVLRMTLAKLGYRVTIDGEEIIDEDTEEGAKESTEEDGKAQAAPGGEMRQIDLVFAYIDDEETNSYSQGVRATLDGEVLLDIPPEKNGPTSIYVVQGEALIKLARLLGIQFTPGSILEWM